MDVDDTLWDAYLRRCYGPSGALFRPVGREGVMQVADDRPQRGDVSLTDRLARSIEPRIPEQKDVFRSHLCPPFGHVKEIAMKHVLGSASYFCLGCQK